MKSQQGILRGLTWALLIFAVLFALYLRTGLLPTQALRQRAQEQLFAWTGQRIFFTKAIYLPGLGLSLDDFQILKQDGPPLFSVDRLNITVKIIPLLMEKKIIISNLMLLRPQFDWSAQEPAQTAQPIRTQISGQIPVPVAPASHTITLTSLQMQGTDALLPENVYLEQIEIRRGLARFHGADKSLIETIEIMDLKMSYRKPPVVDISGEIQIGSAPYATLQINGGWDLEKAGYEFFLRFKSDRVPAWLEPFQQKHILVLEEGRIELAAKLKSITESRASFHAKSKLSNARIRAAHASIHGQTSFDAKGIFDFDRRTFESYRGTLFLDAADLKNLSVQFPRIDNVSGQVGFEPDLVTIQSIRGQWQKLGFEAKGTIRSFKELLLEGEIRSKLDIQDALALIPAEQKKLISGFRLSGKCDALTTLKGSLRKGATLQREHRLVIEDGSLENSARKLKLEKLQAELFADQQGIQIRNAHFRSGTTFYRMSASIPQKPASRGALQLATSAWKLRAQYAIEGEDLRVREGFIEGYGSSLSFAGLVGNIQNPWLNIKGQVQTDLRRLSDLPLPAAHALQGAGLHGQLSGPFTLSGPWNNPMKWDLRLDGRSKQITIYKHYRLDQFEIQLRSQNGLVSIPYIHAKPYGGSLAASYNVDLNRSPALFNAHVTASDLQLSRIAQDLEPPRNDLEGRLLFEVAIEGPLSNPSGWQGKGSAGILNGKFGKTDRFKEMGKLPFVRVEGMDDVTFHQLRATFDIVNRQIRTKDLSIYGDNVNLFLYGSIGLDARLDLGMRIRYSESVLDGALDTGGIVPFVLSEANDMIADYHVRGTITKPVFEKSFLPVNPVGTVGKKVNALARSLTS